ncbi:unnamed protein product [Chrysoparadoxa australica]
MGLVFMIVGRSEPLYELELQSETSQDGDGAHPTQLILHSALDMVERKQWTTTNLHLKVVDKFNDQVVSAYVTAGGLRLLLLHAGQGDDGIRSFFMDVHELYVKHMLNPFYMVDSPIVSPAFEQRVRSLARKHLL